MRSGILLLDKPSGMTSNAALQRVRKAYRADKAGHGGTLDPMATGMLPIFIDEATRFAGHVLSERKAYVASIRFGFETTAADRDGDPTRHAETPEITDARLTEVLAGLSGRIKQRPPVYSAIKLNGTPLYTLARMGMDVIAPEREVEIHSIKVVARSLSCARPIRLESLLIEVVCGSGTYIRSLAEDIGKALGSAAHLDGLRRTWVGGFQNLPMISLETLESTFPAQRGGLLMPVGEILRDLPALVLNDVEVKRLITGQRYTIRDERVTSGPSRLLDSSGEFLGLGELDAQQILRVIRLMPTESRLPPPQA